MNWKLFFIVIAICCAASFIAAIEGEFVAWCVMSNHDVIAWSVFGSLLVCIAASVAWRSKP